MRFRTTYSISIALLLLAAGCSKQEAVREQGNFPADHIIRVSTEVAPATKGSYTTDNITEFDLMVTDWTKSAYTYTNTRFSKSASGEWVPEKTLLWGGAKDIVTVYAVAPCFKTRNFKTNSFQRVPDNPDDMCEVEAEQSEESKKSDYLYWVGASNDNKVMVEDCLAEDGKLKIQFTHLLSLVRITFKLGTEFNNGGVPQSNIISDVVISGTRRSFWISSTMYYGALAARAWTEAAASDVKPYNLDWTSAVNKTGNCTSVYECILVPQTMAEGDLKISFKAGGKAYEWVAPELTFSPNTAHTLTLKVGKDAVIAGGFTATEWVNENSTILETE